jgi:tryptophan synthase alpha chain
MSRIDNVFSKPGRKALIPYVTVGYPDITATLSVVPAFARASADIIELGIPFSDPLADGATIQRASFNALKNGVTPKMCIEMAAKLSKQIRTPLAFMTYANPVFSYGLKEFCRDSAKAGVSGLIIPDLPPEEAVELEREAKSHGIDLIYFLAPTTSDSRIKLVASRASGFIYLVSVAGVTGARNALPVDLAGFIARVKKTTDKPVCVGFGISTPEQAKEVSSFADGVIIGSRIIQLMETEGVEAAVSFLEELRKAIDS